MLTSLPIPAKIKAIVAFAAAIVIVATGVVTDSVLDWTDVQIYGVQAVEAVLTYVATFQARNRVVLTYRDVAAQDDERGWEEPRW